MSGFYTKIECLYSTSFYEIISSKNKLEEVISEVKKLRLSLNKDSSWLELISAPIYSFTQKKAMISNLCELISPEFRNFFNILMINNRWRLLPSILEHFEYLYNLSQNMIPVEIEVVEQLDNDQKNMIIKQIESFFGTKIIPEFTVNEKILGGFIVKKDNVMYDASLLNTLSSYKEKVKDKILQLELNK